MSDLSTWRTLEEILEDATLEDLGKAYLWNQDQLKLIRAELTTLQAEKEALQMELEGLMSTPPCRECGAMTQEEGEEKCICIGDKDDCHGCRLWP